MSKDDKIKNVGPAYGMLLNFEKDDVDFEEKTKINDQIRLEMSQDEHDQKLIDLLTTFEEGIKSPFGQEFIKMCNFKRMDEIDNLIKAGEFRQITEGNTPGDLKFSYTSVKNANELGFKALQYIDRVNIIDELLEYLINAPANREVVIARRKERQEKLKELRKGEV